MPTKELLIVAGPNGSGKSTFVAAYLAERDCPYLCADTIAAQLDITDEFVRQYTAGQKFYTQAAELLAAGNDFIVEITYPAARGESTCNRPTSWASPSRSTSFTWIPPILASTV